jgi:dihydroorotate dehydrogenase (fumarate)
VNNKMPNLQVDYMGLKLTSPVVVASSGITQTVESIVKCAKAGAGAIVLKSLFEEQISAEVEHEIEQDADSLYLPEADDYVRNYTSANAIGKYLTLISQAKKSVDIPVIASIHCVSANHWTSFAKDVEKAGADGIELNIFIPPYNRKVKAKELEKRYLDIVSAVKANTSLPISLKIGYYFTNIYASLHAFSKSGIKGLVLFNRFLHPDIDVETLEITHGSVLSTPDEAPEVLRWIGLLSPELKVDMAATTGIHQAPDAIKMILAGAKVVQLCSTIMKNGTEQITKINNEIKEWMQRKEFSTVKEFQGLMAKDNKEMGPSFERVQYMKLSFGEKK